MSLGEFFNFFLKLCFFCCALICVRLKQDRCQSKAPTLNALPPVAYGIIVRVLGPGPQLWSG